jgi:hypothetical protein
MIYEYVLCAGRHETPATECLFDKIEDPTDVMSMRCRLAEVIPSDATLLVVYVTGLTVAMLAVVKFCELNGISLIARHYDISTGRFFDQSVLSFKTCPACGRRYPARRQVCPYCWGE